MSLENLTVVIVTYRTPEKIILDCINSISKEVKILIIENSENFLHKNIINSEFSNVEVLCTGENLGYGKGNNFGLNNVKSDFALILNPDVICDKDFFTNISQVISEANDFTLIGCQYMFDKIFMPAGFFDKKKNEIFKKKFQNNNIDSLMEVEWVTGCSMLLNLKRFTNKDIFDKNFFLYFEEVDLCKSIIDKGEKIYSSNKLKINHLGFKSSFEDSSVKKGDINKIREWHWMWSSFYFYKKNYNYFYASYKMSGKLIKSFCKLLFYYATFHKKKREKYLFRFLGLINSFLNKPSFYREKN